MIRDIAENDLTSVAKIHKLFLPSIIAFYSEGFIENFYKFHLVKKKEDTIFKGYFEGDKLLGFVFGTFFVDKLFDEFIAANKAYFIKETLFALVYHPKYFIHLLEKVFPTKVQSKCLTQLVYIVVDKTSTTKGIGKLLLQNFETDASKRVDYYELEVEKNNTAQEFYKKNNFFIVEEINNIVEKKYLLGKNLL